MPSRQGQTSLAPIWILESQRCASVCVCYALYQSLRHGTSRLFLAVKLWAGMYTHLTYSSCVGRLSRPSDESLPQLTDNPGAGCMPLQTRGIWLISAASRTMIPSSCPAKLKAAGCHCWVTANHLAANQMPNRYGADSIWTGLRCMTVR